MSGRKRGTFIVTVDLDPVPGWGNDPDDWRRMLEHYLTSAVPHYNPAVIDAESLADDEALLTAICHRQGLSESDGDIWFERGEFVSIVLRDLAAALAERGAEQ